MVTISSLGHDFFISTENKKLNKVGLFFHSTFTMLVYKGMFLKTGDYKTLQASVLIEETSLQVRMFCYIVFN